MKRQHPTDQNLFWCNDCGQYKGKNKFGRNSQAFHGIRGYCRECENEREKKRVKDHERINEYKRNWRKKNKDPNKRTRRRHEDNPCFFWCSKCKTYKERVEFGIRRAFKHGVASECKECRSKSRSPFSAKRCERCGVELAFQGDRRSYCKVRYCPACRKEINLYYSERYRNRNLDECKRKCSDKNNYSVKSLRDPYVKRLLTVQGIMASPEAIKLKRQQITLHRNIKQLKEVANGLNQ